MSTSTIHRYGLAAPTLAEVRAAVHQGAGDEETWTGLCAAAGVSPGATTADLDQLAALVAAVKASPGVLGVLGHSLSVRLHTYRTLAKLEGLGR